MTILRRPGAGSMITLLSFCHARMNFITTKALLFLLSAALDGSVDLTVYKHNCSADMDSFCRIHPYRTLDAFCFLKKEMKTWRRSNATYPHRTWPKAISNSVGFIHTGVSFCWIILMGALGSRIMAHVATRGIQFTCIGGGLGNAVLLERT